MIALLAFVLLLCVSSDAAAQRIAGLALEAEFLDPETSPRPVGRATRTDQPIGVDGVLAEAAWQEAEVLTNFVQSQPNRGYAATFATTARILYDAKYLYLSAVCDAPEPERLTMISLEPGCDGRESAVIGMTLDPFLDQRNSFMFLIRRLGAPPHRSPGAGTATRGGGEPAPDPRFRPCDGAARKDRSNRRYRARSRCPTCASRGAREGR
jgi:hypothetical protein